MALRAGAAYVDIIPNVGRSFEATLTREVEGPASKLAGNLKKIVAGIGGAVVAKKTFDFLSDSVAAARESNRVAAQTEAVIKSTGGAAGITEKHVGELAERISQLTGIDDELIQAGENVLLTFTNVRNGVGKGNDVFDQATRLANDMSVALGTDLQGSIIQVGKALNDPIRGVTALQRVGVSFTEQQREQIKTLVESGRTMDAQKIILAELAKEFGGTAQAVATPGERLKVTLGNIQEAIGNRLVPLLDQAAVFLADRLPGALDAAGRGFNVVKGYAEPVIRVVGQVADAFKALLGDDGPQAFGELLDNAFGNTGRYVAVFRTLGESILKVASFIGDNLQPILVGLGAAFAVVAAPIATVVAALVVAYARFEGFRDVVDPVVKFLAGTVAPAVVAFAKGFADVIGGLVDYVRRIWPQVSEAIGHVLAVVEAVVEVFVANVTAVWRVWGDDIARIAAAVFAGVRDVIAGVLGVVRGIIQTFLALINGDWGKAWAGLRSIVAGVFEALKGIVFGAMGTIFGFLAGAGDTIRRLASGMFDGIKNAFRAAINWIIRAWNSLEFKIPGFSLGPVRFGGFTLGVPDIPLLARGGTTLSSGLAVVGEAGPELVHLPRGADVIPLDRGLNPGGAGVTIEHLEVHGQDQPAATAREVVRAFKKASFLAAAAGRL